MNISKEEAAAMQLRVNALKNARLFMSEFANQGDMEKRTQSPHTPLSTKEAASAQPRTAKERTQAQPRRKKNTEYNIQKEYVQRMGQLHPEILIFSDAAAHVAKSMIQQVRANALQSKGQKWPDVFVAQPSGDYAGLFLEFKAETPYKVDGVTLKKSDHVEAQARTMQELTCKGYICSFVWSVEIALDVTESYLNSQL